MKKKLGSLLSIALCFSLIVTMFMGMNLRAFAADPNIVLLNEGDNYDSGLITIPESGINFKLVFGESTSIILCPYVDDSLLGSPQNQSTSELNTLISSEYLGNLETFLQKTLKAVVRCTWDATTKTQNLYLYTETYYDEHYGSSTVFTSVSVDLGCVRAGKTLWDIFSSIASSISTTPEDTTDILSINLTHGSSDSELLEPTEPLEEGKIYTLWLTLQSSDCLFKQDSVSDYALSNLNIDVANKNVFLDDTYAAADEGKILDMEIRFTVDSSAPGPNPDSAPSKYTPDMATVNIEGATFNTWEEITANTPNLTAEKLQKVNASNDDLLHVNIVGKSDKTVPVSAVQAMDKSTIGGLHVFIGESDAVTFFNSVDYANYTGKNFAHNDTFTENSRTIDFKDKGSINATVMFHSLIAPNATAKIYKVVDGAEVLIGTASSNEFGGICFAINDLATYVIRY